MSCRYLVTGGAGFIGSCFIRYILENHPDYKIVNLDSLTYAGNLKNLGDYQYHPGYSFLQEDICNINKCNLNSEFDWIINFAADTFVDRSIIKPYPFLHTNVLGLFALLEFAKKHKIKILHTSTDEVYGSTEIPTNELSKLNPSSPYSASKASGDLLVSSYFKTYNLPFIIIRPSNNYGPFQFIEKFIPLFITNLLMDKEIPLYGKGNQSREWLYVFDLCRAIDLILKKGKLNEIYNIGSGEIFTNLEVTQMILTRLKISESKIKNVKDRPGHDFSYSIDSKKIQNLGWKPLVEFNSGLQETIKWYRENQNWWKSLNHRNLLQ